MANEGGAAEPCVMNHDPFRPTQKLKVGIMCHGAIFPRWQANAIKHLVAVRSVEIALLIVDMGEETAREPSLRSKLTHAAREGVLLCKVLGRIKAYFLKYIFLQRVSLWHIYRKLWPRFSPLVCDAAVDLSALLEGVAALPCRVQRRGRFSQYFSATDIETIRTYNLDVILRFGFDIIRGEILDVPRYGVWSYHHDDHLRYRGQPPGFWEVYHGDPLNGAMLQRLTEKLDDGVIIHKEFFRTVRHSYGKNLNQIFMGSARWPATACRLLLQGFGDRVFAASSASDAPIYKCPTNLQLSAYFFKASKNFVRKHYQDFCGESSSGPDNWAIGIVNEPAANLLAWNAPRHVRWLVPPEGRFFADPFLIKARNVTFIFFEDFDYGTGKGRIGVIETSDFLTISEPRTVLERPFHLSYPCVFEHEGRHYCVPEQYQSREVTLYEAEDFPDRWVKRVTLIDNFAGVDPTLFQHEGRWWLFLTNRDTGDETNLYVFFADNLFGPWRPHPKNPVRTADHAVRPAGRPFMVDDMLLRPTQNGLQTYGGSVIVNAVTVLTTNEFEERFVHELEPKAEWPYPDGLHTLSTLDNITLIDAKRRLPVRNEFGKVFIGKTQSARTALSRVLKPMPAAARDTEFDAEPI